MKPIFKIKSQGFGLGNEMKGTPLTFRLTCIWTSLTSNWLHFIFRGKNLSMRSLSAWYVPINSAHPSSPISILFIYFYASIITYTTALRAFIKAASPVCYLVPEWLLNTFLLGEKNPYSYDKHKYRWNFVTGLEDRKTIQHCKPCSLLETGQVIYCIWCCTNNGSVQLWL